MSESARITRLLAASQCEEIRRAIQRQKSLCCAPRVETASIIPVESGLEQAKGDVNTWGIVFPGATVIQGTTVGPESARIRALSQAVIDSSTDPTNPETRFSMYRRPYVPPVCPAIPTAILNGNLPKPSTKPICEPQRFEGVVTLP